MKELKTKPHFNLPVILKTLFFSALVILLLYYALWQGRLLISGPLVYLDTKPSATSSSRVIELTGRTENITKISLNGRSISTNGDGRFNEEVVLKNGRNIITLQGFDRFSRNTIVRHPVVYLPPKNRAIINN